MIPKRRYRPNCEFGEPLFLSMISSVLSARHLYPSDGEGLAVFKKFKRPQKKEKKIPPAPSFSGMSESLLVLSTLF